MSHEPFAVTSARIADHNQILHSARLHAKYAW
jgi:hypothetical protein